MRVTTLATSTLTVFLPIGKYYATSLGSAEKYEDPIKIKNRDSFERAHSREGEAILHQEKKLNGTT